MEYLFPSRSDALRISHAVKRTTGHAHASSAFVTMVFVSNFTMELFEQLNHGLRSLRPRFHLLQAPKNVGKFRASMIVLQPCQIHIVRVATNIRTAIRFGLELL
jgi:hypothetical protein